MSDADELSVCSRISYDGRLCTIRYIGTLAGSSHQYLGVEWDDPSNGKHNGEHNGVRYFTCLSHAERPASFVRRKRPRDTRRSFVEALTQKYASDEQEGDQNDVIRISGRDVEEVGFDKIKRQQANLRGLKVIVLDGMRIGSTLAANISSNVAAGVAEYCPSCTRLDISRNLLESWDEISAIIEQLPALTELHVNGNRFGLRTKEPNEEQAQIFLNVKILGLDDCLLSWQDIQFVTARFPNLQELSTCLNQLVDLNTGHLPSSLMTIKLDGNDLGSLTQLGCLTQLPKLKHLGLKGNKISVAARRSTVKDSQGYFNKALSEVDLSQNLVSDWSFVNQLSQVFPGLVSLRLSSNPLYRDLKDAEGAKLDVNDAFMLTAARLAILQMLNYSKIDGKARHNAELYYLSQIGKELSIYSGLDDAAAIERHPRYRELCAQYGEPTVARNSLSAIGPNSLAAQVVRCTVQLGSSFTHTSYLKGHAGSHSIEVEILRSFNIYSATSMIAQRLPIVRPMEIDIIWETGEELLVKSESDSDSDDEHVKENDRKTSKNRPLLREELLVPRTRRIGTWLEGATASLRLEKRLPPTKSS